VGKKRGAGASGGLGKANGLIFYLYLKKMVFVFGSNQVSTQKVPRFFDLTH
jgi:hypothetical protein